MTVTSNNQNSPHTHDSYNIRTHHSRVPRVVYHFPTTHGCNGGKTTIITNLVNYVYWYVYGVLIGRT